MWCAHGVCDVVHGMAGVVRFVCMVYTVQYVACVLQPASVTKRKVGCVPLLC